MTGIYLSDSIVETVPGLTHQLTSTITPLTATNKAVTWVSTNDSVATVDCNGLVTAVSTGVAYIIAETEDGSFTETCRVIVTNSAAGFALDSRSEAIDIGGTVQLTGKFVPADAENQNVSWLSSDETVATVDANGLVRGKKAGSVVIAVTTQDGGYRDYCIVRVVGIAAELHTNAYVDGKTGFIYGIGANAHSVDGLVKLTDNTCTLEYVNSGSCIGTGSVVNIKRNGETVDSFTVILMGDVNGDGFYNAADAQAVNSILTDDKNNDISEAFALAADADRNGEITKEDATLLAKAGNYLDGMETTEYNNSDKWSIYSNLVDQSYEGNRKESIRIVGAQSMNVGDTLNLQAVYDLAGVEAAVDWVSTNNGVIAVDENGKVTAKAFGKTTIYATDEFGRTAVTVLQALDSNAHITLWSASDTMDVKVNWWKKYNSAHLVLGLTKYSMSDNYRIEWTSSNPNVTVSEQNDTVVITNNGKRAAKSTITATAYAADGSVVCKAETEVSFYKFGWQKKMNLFTHADDAQTIGFFDSLLQWFGNIAKSIGTLFQGM